MNLDLTELEKVLLPENCRFSDLQKAVINSSECADIVAGPGSGKTTVLMAKFAGIFKQMKDDNQNICIITHTNVAVDEIKTHLKKVGINEIGYPHFIGTIHEFFNYFFTKNAFHELFIDEDIDGYEILDSDEYKIRFKEIFNIYKEPDYTFEAPTSLVDTLQIELSLNENNKTIINFRGYCNERYKSAVYKCFRYLFNQGVFRHNDTLSLCEWYINKYQAKIRSGFSERFSWVIMDETQDASLFQFSLLDKIIDVKKVFYQRYGDPYQALYNNSTENVWVPGQHFTEEQLSESTRFGNNIAKVLKTTCIEEYKNLNGNPRKTSYKPHLLIFKDNKGLIERYKILIKELEDQDKEFEISRKKVSVLALEHMPLQDFKDDYVRVKNSNIGYGNVFKIMYDQVIKVYFKSLQNYIGDSKIIYSEFLKGMNNKLSNEKAEIAKGLRLAYINSGIIDKEFFIKNYISITKKLDINVRNETNVIIQLGEEILKIFISYTTQGKLGAAEKSEEIYFGTVHGVKGETHKSTLLLDTIFNIKYERKWGKFSLFELIEPYLFGKHTNVNQFEGMDKLAIIKALKSAYVALSRATHLISVAVDEKTYNKDINALISKAKQNNWEVIRV